MKWSVGAKIAAAFGLTLLIFIIVGAIFYAATTRSIEASESRKHTYENLVLLDEAFSLLKDVEIGQRSYALMEDERYLEPYHAAVNGIEPRIQALRKSTADEPRQQKRLDALEPLIRQRIDFATKVIDVERTSGAEAALELTKSGRDKELMDQIRTLVGEMAREEEALLKERIAAADRDAQNAKRAILAGTLLAILTAVASGFVIARNIATPLRQLTTAAERITAGDLNVSLPPATREDEVGILARAFHRMTDSLRSMAIAAEGIASGDLRTVVKPQSTQDILGNAFARMVEDLRAQIREISEGANVLGAAASEIVASTSQLAATASESAAAVSETTTTVEEVRQTAQLASEKARFVSDSAQKAAQVSQGGKKSADDVVGGINRIRQQMEAIASSMVRLSEQSHAIGQIIATVEEIAIQSNLLAVNAAIEAAKAGEQGKGFSVVAQEVRSLAERSRQATNQVRTILSDIQKATGAAVMATEEGSKAVEAGVRQSEIAGASIQALSSTVNEAAQAATQISASSQQQLVGVNQVAGAMESIRQASTQNVTSAKQLESAARNLNDLGQRLKTTVERYQV